MALIGLGFGAYQALVGSKHVTTDNAYVDTDAAQVNALTSGPVKDVRVVDTQTVRKGDILVVIDDTDRRLELEQAQSALGDIERRVQGYQANNTALDGQIMARQADVVRAGAELARANDYGGASLLPAVVRFRGRAVQFQDWSGFCPGVLCAGRGQCAGREGFL